MSQHSDNCPTTYLTFLKKLASFADFFPYQNVHKKKPILIPQIYPKNTTTTTVFFTQAETFKEQQLK